MGAHGMDSAGRRSPSRCIDPEPVRPRSLARSISPLALALALALERRRRSRAAGVWRHPLRALGNLFPHHLGIHSTWLVNSATHLWGSRRFKTRDDSTNNWWVALLTFGEGWHNNHHATPPQRVTAWPGRARYQLDWHQHPASGLAWDVKVAKIGATRPSEADEAVA